MMDTQTRGNRRLALVALLLGACSIAEPALPGGFAVQYGDRGKAWLANPDGTLTHGALVKELRSDDRHILLIGFAEAVSGHFEGPRPLDGNCYMALLIDSRSRQMRQVTLDEAKRLASRMKTVKSFERECLPGMPAS